MGEAAAYVIGAVIAGGSAIAADRRQRKASKAQEEAQEVEQRMASVRNRRQRRVAFQRLLAQQARTRAQGAATGAVTSAEAGAISGQASQAGETLSFQSSLQQLDNQRFRHLEKANKNLAGAQRAQAASDLTFKALPFVNKITGQFDDGPKQQ